MTPQEIIRDALIPDTRSVLVLGCFETRVTVYAQQVRALNLVDAILSESLVRSKGKIAIVGGGVAGMTAAVALARAAPDLAALDLFEARPGLLEFQHNSQRYLHPHFYDWPAARAQRLDAALPIMNWSAGPAGVIAEALREEFVRTERGSILQAHPEEQVIRLRPTALGSVQLATRNSPTTHRTYDAVILAIGFGLERFLDGDTSSYWSPSILAAPIHTGLEKPIIFISGNGDGGLVDFQMAAFGGMDHGKICQLIAEFNLGDARTELEVIEREAWSAGADVDLLDSYRTRVVPLVPPAIWAEVNQKLRKNARVWFHTREPYLLKRTTALHNRLGAFLVIEADREMGNGAITIKTGVEFDGPPPSTGDVALIGEAPFRPWRRFLRLGPDAESNLAPFADVLAKYPAATRSPTSTSPPVSPTLTASARARFEQLSNLPQMAASVEASSSVAAKPISERAFEALIALECSIDMLLDPEIEWLELDSTLSLPGTGRVLLGDIVIQYKDGRLVCCECKNIQPRSGSWTVPAFSSALQTAGLVLRSIPTAEVRFFSTVNLGPLQSLRNLADSSSNATTLEASVDSSLLVDRRRLAEMWDANPSTQIETLYSFLRRTSFDVLPHIENLEARVRQRLARCVTRADEAFRVLRTELEKLGAPHTLANANAAVHRLTRAQAFKLLQDAGCEVSEPKDDTEALKEFRTASAVGRSWRRDIGGRKLQRAATDDLLAAIVAKQRSVLLTDGPGAGKTCILLDLVDRLDRSPDIASLFIQAREFAEAQTDAERVALGLPADIPSIVSSLSVGRHVVVIIDSLDVLALAREISPLSYFLSLIDRLSTIPNTTTVVACRAFDLQYDRRLSARAWDQSVVAGELDWTGHIEPVVEAAGAQSTALDERTRSLLSNARLLALFADLVAHGGGRNVSSAQELTEAYLDEVVLKQMELGESAMQALESMADEMLTGRVSDVPRGAIQASNEVLQRLQSEQVILPTRNGKRLAFGHQTLLDSLAVRRAVRAGRSLLDFVVGLPAVPFVRPTVRAYFNYLRLGDEVTFRKQLRAAFDSDIAYHLKRLLAESWAAAEPASTDWPLLSHLEQRHVQLFHTILERAQGRQWKDLFESRWLPRVLNNRESANLQLYISKLSSWSEGSEEAIIEFWSSAFNLDWLDPRSISRQISLQLQRIDRYPENETERLLGRLVDLGDVGDYFLSSTLMRFAAKTGRGDALIWRFITGRLVGQKFDASQLRLDRIDQNFLKDRFLASEQLLNGAVSSLEAWSRSKANSDEWREGFLRSTSFDKIHSSYTFRHETDLQRLVGSMEEAILDHAGRDTPWWRANARRLAFNADGGLRHIALVALRKGCQTNLEVAKDVLVDPRTFENPALFELGLLIQNCLFHLSSDVHETVSEHALELFSTYDPAYRVWVDEQRLALLARIPTPCRSDQANQEFLALSRRYPVPSEEPEIHMRGGAVHSPYARDELLRLDDEALLSLLRFSVGLSRFTDSHNGFAGGVDQVEVDIRQMAMSDSRRFLGLMRMHWSQIPPNFRTSMLQGAVAQLRNRFGNVQYAPVPNYVESMDGALLEHAVRDELQRHDYFWSRTMVGAEAVLACSHVVQGDASVHSLLFLAAGYAYNRSPECWESGDYVGLSSVRGQVAEGMTTLLARRIDAQEDIPVMLRSIVGVFANDWHPQIRTIVLSGIPRLLFEGDKLGWDLFEAALSGDGELDWLAAENALYAAYHRHYDRIRQFLNRARESSMEGGQAVWGRITALAVLSGHLTLEVLLDDLICTGSEDGWSGAMQVWVANLFHPEHQNTCLAGLRVALTQPKAGPVWQREAGTIFAATESALPLPLAFLQSLVTSDFGGQPRHLPNHLDDWLAANSDYRFEDSLELAQTAVAEIKAGAEFYFDNDSLGVILTSLFREAEDREELDDGSALKRVIALQDAVLSLPHTSIESWLRAAERPEGI
ncbi:hypothetical protein ACFJGW_04900 [Burkholderiaceae bacterium UC74_6]